VARMERDGERYTVNDAAAQGNRGCWYRCDDQRWCTRDRDHQRSADWSSPRASAGGSDAQPCPRELMLVAVLIAQGKPDEACAVAQEVLDATPQLGSYLVIQQLLDLKQLLDPHRSNRVVADFLVCFDEALRERVWLYQWLTEDGRGQATGFGERR
jgi:hypothetical protein